MEINWNFTKVLPGILVCLAILSFAETPFASAPPPPPSFTTLQPGGFRDIAQNLQINIVLVGYEQGAGPQQINQATLQSWLPATYRSVNRLELLYGNTNFVGTSFNYSYNFVYTNAAFENAFFGYLGSIAQPQPRTVYQDAYNVQASRTANVGQNHAIEAPAVEQWLANNAGPMLGVNTAQYTVFLVNWYGRPDFKFHTYVKTDEPATDTSFNHGLRQSRRIIAWGGTTSDDNESGLGSLHRIWFYDLSAGPESATNNWNLDNADLLGDGVLDYRMPPVWEYGNLAAYRPFNDLSGDLGKIVRYVAINTLFTTSPLYRPGISAPKLPSEIQLDINMYQADPSVDGKNFLTPSVLAQEVGKLQPLNTFSTEVTDQRFAARAAQIYGCWTTATAPPFLNQSCYGNTEAINDLVLFHGDQAFRSLEGDEDYEVPVYIYNTTPELFNQAYLGIAFDNFNGIQSQVYVFSDPLWRNLGGLGMTDLAIHEVGHHLGMSHPHDGYDYETNTEYNPNVGPFYFTWTGTESNTVMSYLDLNNDFSQFDRDNMNRYLTATYINQANAILPRILAKPQAGQVAGLLSAADAQAASALTAYASMNYLTASAFAKSAYQKVLTAAAQINVHIEPQAPQADRRARGRSSIFMDSVYDRRLEGLPGGN